MIMQQVFRLAGIFFLMSMFPLHVEGQCTEFTGTSEAGYVSHSGSTAFTTGGTCQGDGNLITLFQQGDGFTYGPAGSSGTVSLSGFSKQLFLDPTVTIAFRNSPNGSNISSEQFQIAKTCNTHTTTASISAGQYVNVTFTDVQGAYVYFDQACIGGSNPLPVELTSFRAFVRNDHVALKWTTESELNNYGFEVQKRKGDGIWEPIGFVQGAGTSSTPLHYSFGDKTPLKSVTTYRLKQVDRDGTTTFSEEVTVQPLTVDITGLQVYPNPLLTEGHLSFELSETQSVSIAVYDLTGRMVHRIANAEQMDAGCAFIPFSVSGLNPGQYTVAVYTAGDMRTVRISKLH